MGRLGRLAAFMGVAADYLFLDRRVDLSRPAPRADAVGADDLFNRLGLFSRRGQFRLESL